jgi:hypothetical protein
MTYTGVPGMLLYLSAFVVLAQRIGKSTRGRRGDQLFGAAGIGILVFLAITAINDNPVRNQDTMFPLMAAIGCCLSGSTAVSKPLLQ